MLIKHVRDDNRVPFATIVCINTREYGLSVCSPKDRFSKKRGIEIAKARATKMVNTTIPRREVQYKGDVVDMYSVLDKELVKLRQKCERLLDKQD